jgi:hypothetical protein
LGSAPYETHPLLLRLATRACQNSETGAAKLFRADERTARRWALGESDIPTGVAMLLNLLVAGRLRLKDVENAL